MDDVIVTPHAAVANREFYRGVAALVGENVERLIAGEEPRNREYEASSGPSRSCQPLQPARLYAPGRNSS